MSGGGAARRVTLGISIDESVGEELVKIGSTMTKTLKQHISDRIDDIERYQRTGKSIGLSPAEELALGEGNNLEVSWVPTEKNSAGLRRNALLQAYEDQHSCKPGFQSRMTGKWVPGNQRVGKKAERGDLDWSPWEPVSDRTKAILPTEHGVLRIRVAR